MEPSDAKRVLVLVTDVIRNLREHPSFTQEANGGYFALSSSEDCQLLFLVRIGYVEKEVAEEYVEFALEMSRRLFRNKGKGHVTSWQSRNEANEEYGGAITVGHLIISFAGFSEAANEIVALKTALCRHRLTLAQALAIAQISDNCYKNLL